MYKNKRVAVVMPAYNAEKTLREAYDEVVAQGVADTIVLVDDCSKDGTEAVAKSLVDEGEEAGFGQRTKDKGQRPRTFDDWTVEKQETRNQKPETFYHRHDHNRGYGGNQKTCYELALKAGADIVVMVHPDCQYTPKLLVPMVAMIAEGLHPCVLASRILGGYALKGGMPWWKYLNNRWLTAAMNLLFGSKLSEFHTGYRAFSAELLKCLPLGANTDDFAFDAQMLAEILWTGATIGEVSCPTVYTPEASSISFRRSCTYGFGCLGAAIGFRLAKLRLHRSSRFPRCSL